MRKDLSGEVPHKANVIVHVSLRLFKDAPRSLLGQNP